MSLPPRISIITPSFNQGRYLDELIESVLAQGDPNFEHIVMDGGSTDETVEVLRRYPHVKWRSEKDEGQSDAVCKALALATGDLVGWINSDDFYYPGAFAAAREAFEQDPSLGVVTGDYRFVDAAGRLLKERRELAFDRGVYLYAGKSTLGNGAAFFRKPLLDRYGGPRKDLHHSMDFELFLRVSESAKFGHVRRVLASYRFHEASKTTTDLARGVRESLSVRLEYLSREQGGPPLRVLPAYVRFLGAACMARRIVRKLMAGCYGRAARSSKQEAGIRLRPGATAGRAASRKRGEREFANREPGIAVSPCARRRRGPGRRRSPPNRG